MNAAYFVSEDFLSSLNPYLLQFEVASALLLGIGIVYEAPEYPESVHKTAFWLVVIGVFFETVFSILLFASEEQIASSQRGTINLQQANITALEEKLAARSLGKSEIGRMVAALNRFLLTIDTQFNIEVLSS
jgi:hypothetical protein